MDSLESGYYTLATIMSYGEEIAFERGIYLYVASSDILEEPGMWLQNTTYDYHCGSNYELQKADDFFEFAKENEMELESISLTEQLEQFLEKYQKPKKDVIKDAGLDTTYGYQIFDGRKKPRRDKLLQLAFGFPLTIEEANQLFRAGGMSSLYVRCKRDTICMYCLQQGMTVDECNELLYKAGEETF